MNYEIKDNHHSLQLSLESNEMTIPTLEVFINDEELPFQSYNSSTVNSPYIYTIPFSDFTIGDIITKCRLMQNTPVLPWQTQEGVTILIDGEEVTNLNYTNCTTVEDDKVEYTTQFSEGTHDIQAFYVGNNEYNMAMTDKLHFVVSQPPVIPDGDPVNDGAYRLAFYGNTSTSTVYGKTVSIKMQLTKGQVPVNGRTVETIFTEYERPTSKITSTINGVSGLVEFTSENRDAGKYKIGGFFTDDSKTIFSKYKTFTIEKAPCNISINGGSYNKGSTIKFYFKYNDNVAIAKAKVQLYVNGKLTSYTTDKNGAIAYKFGSKGTFKFKAVYKGNNNIKKGEFTTTITISE